MTDCRSWSRTTWWRWRRWSVGSASGRGIDDLAVVTTGAGVGYGLVIHGRQVITPDTGLGLGGHFLLDPTGLICADGHRGCSTAMLSTTSMCASAAVGLGRLVSYDELLVLAASGNAVAVQVVGTAGRSLGRMIAAVAYLTMVGTVMLSGEGIGLVDVPVVASELRAGIAADRDPDASEVRVLTGDTDFSAPAVAVEVTAVTPAEAIDQVRAILPAGRIVARCDLGRRCGQPHRCHSPT